MSSAAVDSFEDAHSNAEFMLNIGTALAALQVLDPGCRYDEWLNIGMGGCTPSAPLFFVNGIHGRGVPTIMRRENVLGNGRRSHPTTERASRRSVVWPTRQIETGTATRIVCTARLVHSVHTIHTIRGQVVILWIV